MVSVGTKMDSCCVIPILHCVLQLLLDAVKNRGNTARQGISKPSMNRGSSSGHGKEVDLSSSTPVPHGEQGTLA